jgi:hypothetical protein
VNSQSQHARSRHEPEYGEGPAGLQRAHELRGGGAHGHLREARPAGGGAGHAGVDADGACRAVGNGEAVAEGRERQVCQLQRRLNSAIAQSKVGSRFFMLIHISRGVG